MIEMNRDILSDAINKMPVRKPKTSNWKHIASGLEQAEAAFFLARNTGKLPRYQAPAGAWDKVAAGLPAAGSAFIGSITGKIIIVLLAFGGLLTAYFLLDLPADEQSTEDIRSAAQAQPDQKNPGAASAENMIALPSVEKHIQTREAVPVKDMENTSAAGVLVPPGMKAGMPDHNRPEPLRLAAKRELCLYAGATGDKQPRMRRPLVNEGTEVEYAGDAPASSFKIGAYYSFKHYQNTGGELMSVPQNQSSAGIDLTYEKGKWLLRTGIEYLSWDEKGIYTYNYDQNQLVYQYNYVDSTSIDPVNGSVTYFTSEQEVYDSVAVQKNGEAINSYKMLQIPLLAGYRFIDKGKTSLSLVGGIGVDIRLSGKQFIPVFNERNSTLREVSSSMKYRAGHNWRVVLGLEAKYRFAQGFELYGEPGYQWYMKPLYAPDNTAGLGLFNMKIGIRYEF